jgi:hypothetical protein
MNLSDSLNDSLGDHYKITPDIRTLDAEFDTNKYSQNIETSHQNIQVNLVLSYTRNVFFLKWI